MATSSIYSWPEPDNTDLVKNGALAIRTLGNAIDTTMGTMVAKTIIDAKGDLIAGTAADTAARLAVGTNDYFLQAASGEATGLKWAGTWTDYTPVLTGPVQGNGTIFARYLKIGKMVTVEFKFTLGSTSTIGADNFISLPFSAPRTGATIPVALMDFGTTQFMGFGYLQYADTIRLLIANTGTTYGSGVLVTSTVPFTWTTNDDIQFSITYEVA